MSAAYIQATPIVGPTLLFATVADFNNYISGLYVNIVPGVLPPATTTTFGAVEMASIAAYAPAIVIPTYATLNISGVALELPSKQAYDDLKLKVDIMGGYLVLLMAAMESAGQLDIT